MRAIQAELDQARDGGPLKSIVIPPCPDLLARMQDAMNQAEPDLNEVARIAGSDVAMSAALIRLANSPAFLTGQPVQTIGQALNRLGLDQTAAEMADFLVRRALPVLRRATISRLAPAPSRAARARARPVPWAPTLCS